MKIRMTTGLLAPVVALVALLLGVLAAVPSPASADDPVITVTWPTITAFNPDVYDYVVNVAYDGPGELRLVDGPHRQTQVIGSGDSRAEFQYDGYYLLRVDLCQDGTCNTISQSPTLQVHREIFVYGTRAGFGPNVPVMSSVAPVPSGLGLDPVQFDVTWEVLPPDVPDDSSTVLLSGSASGVTVGPAVPDNDVLVEQQAYKVRIHAELNGPEWGHLEADIVAFEWWDSVAPSDPSMKLSYLIRHERRNEQVASDVFYPVKDGRGDYLKIDMSATSWINHGVLEVRDPSGQLVERTQASVDGRRWGASWDGRDEHENVLPEGTYQLKAFLYDGNENVATVEREARISHKRVVIKTFERTYPAASTVTKEFVGDCGRLKKPARASWSRSLGYLSSLPCPRPDQTIVATNHAVRIPYSNLRDYISTRISVTGGRSTRASSWLLLFYWQPWADDWSDGYRLTDAVTVHHGPTFDARNTVLGADSRSPYVAWEVGLSSGAKYDVKSFTVEAKYRVFQ